MVMVVWCWWWWWWWWWWWRWWCRCSCGSCRCGQRRWTSVRRRRSSLHFPERTGYVQSSSAGAAGRCRHGCCFSGWICCDCTAANGQSLSYLFTYFFKERIMSYLLAFYTNSTTKYLVLSIQLSFSELLQVRYRGSLLRLPSGNLWGSTVVKKQHHCFSWKSTLKACVVFSLFLSVFIHRQHF